MLFLKIIVVLGYFVIVIMNHLNFQILFILFLSLSKPFVCSAVHTSASRGQWGHIAVDRQARPQSVV